MTDDTTSASAQAGNYQIRRGAGFYSEAFMSVEHMPSGCGQDFFERSDLFMFKFLESLASNSTDDLNAFEAWWESGAGIRAADAKGWKGAALAAWQARAAIAASAPTGPVPKLSHDIMNIPCCPYRPDPEFVMGYKMGHRDARHAAADLALAACDSAPTGQGAGLTDAEIDEIVGGFWWCSLEQPDMSKLRRFARAILATRSAGDGQAVSDHDQDVELDALFREFDVDADTAFAATLSQFFYRGVALAAPPPAASVRDAQDAWISVNDQMPRKNLRVLAYFPKESTSVMDGIWDGESFMVNGFDRTKVVTHWRELPVPPIDAARNKGGKA